MTLVPVPPRKNAFPSGNTSLDRFPKQNCTTAPEGGIGNPLVQRRNVTLRMKPTVEVQDAVVRQLDPTLFVRTIGIIGEARTLRKTIQGRVIIHERRERRARTEVALLL